MLALPTSFPEVASGHSAPPPARSQGAIEKLAWPVLALIAALVLPPLAIAALAWETWRETWIGTERELVRQAEAGAEYVLRVVEGQRLAADFANDLLRGLSDQEVRAREAQLHSALRDLVPRLPLVQTVAVSDREGRMLVTANIFPITQDVLIADREWVQALRSPDAPALHVSRVYVGRFDGNLFYGVSSRRTGSGNGLPPDAYDGAVNVSVDPNAVANGLMALGVERGDVTALVRADGEVLLRTPGFPEPLPQIPAGSPLRTFAAAGAERGTYTGRTLGIGPDQRGEARLLAFRRVQTALPLYVTVARPRPLIVARWQASTVRQLAVGIPTWLALAGLAWVALRRSRAVEEAEARGRAEARFRGVFESRALGMSVFDVRTDETLLVNDCLLQMTGAGRSDFEDGRWDWRQVTPPEHLVRDEQAIAEARARGWWDPYEKEYVRPDGSRLPVRVSSAPLPGEAGRVVVLVQDISEQREAEGRRDLLTREVDHRARNALAVVQAALRLTPRTDADAYARAVEGRVAALARALGLLAEGQWTGTRLRALISAELATFLPRAGDPATGAPQVDAVGPDLSLTPAAAQALAMALHELATNATKHGALGVADGRVDIAWEPDHAAAVLRLVWKERGGPPISGPPAARGFGSRVLETVLGGSLRGRVERRWEAEGLVCRMELPLDRALAPDANAGTARVAT